MPPSPPVKIPGKFGLGTLSMTMRPNPPPLKQSIETLKYATTHPDFGVKFINGGDFYGPDNLNLKLLKDFTDKNKEEFNKSLVFSIKGGMDGKTHKPDGSKEGIARSIENVTKFFPPKENRPQILFEIARVDPKVPFNESLNHIKLYLKDGSINGISLSEVGSETIRQSAEAAPISCVELELSILSQDALQNDVIKTLSELEIPVIAYAPLGHGLLTDQTVNHPEQVLNSIEKGDIRRLFDRFKPDTFKQNLTTLKALYDFAHNEKKTSLEGLALSWIVKISNLLNFRGIDKVTKILPIPSGSTKQKIDANLGSIVELSQDDLKKIEEILEKHPIKGLRYNALMEKTLFQ